MQFHVFPGDKPMGLCPLGAFRDNPVLEPKAFGLHLHWTKGILPSIGALDDQAADVNLTIIAVENGTIAGQNRLQEVEQQKAERRNKTKGGPSGRVKRR